MLKEGEFGHREPLNITQDPDHGIVTIEGTNYSYELLLHLGQKQPENEPLFRIITRSDGLVTIQTYHPADLGLSSWPVDRS